MPDRNDPFVLTPDDDRSPEIAEPTLSPLTYRGEGISSGLLMRLWRLGQRMNPVSRKSILEARAYRRREQSSMIRLASSWVRRNPEAAEWVVDVRPERISLEQDLIARVGAVEPEYVREALGFLDRDHEDAEACRAWLEEWRKRYVPTQAMFGKAVEDGPFGWSVLPAHLDHDGLPTFFETLDERAFKALGEDKQQGYRPDDDRKGRYVKVDEKGRKKVDPKYDKGSTDASKQAHKEAVARYLLKHKPVTVRLIPALDCAPILRRGTGRDRWECVALIERALYHPEELLEMGYGWPGLGDRLLVPLAYNADGEPANLGADEIGKDGQFYLYTAYLTCKDPDGHERPVVAWTVGGTSTAYAPGADRTEPESDGQVGMIDFYEALKYTDDRGRTCGLEGPLWGYHGGMHSEDDDPDQYWRPAMHHVLPIIRQLEGNNTSLNAAITQVSFTGHVQRLDAALADSEVGAEAIIDAEGEVRRFTPPRPGEVSFSTGEVSPFQQASIGQDAWRKLAADQLSLQQATAADQMPSGAGQSGHAQIVQLMTGQQAKRQIREGVMAATIAMGEALLRVLTAYAYRYDIGWPIQTTQERPVGDAVVSGRDIAQFDPRWVGEGNWALDAEYPEEENLARVDLEQTLVASGIGNPERVWKALGERDYQTEWKKALKWRLRNSPAYLMRAEMKLAKQTGDEEMVKILKDLQQQGEMTKAGVPGAKNGIPTAALNRQGQQMAGGGPRAGDVSSVRGGIEAAELGADVRAADAQAAFTR